MLSLCLVPKQVQRIISQPLYPLGAIVIPLRVTTIDVKDNVLADAASFRGIVQWPRVHAGNVEPLRAIGVQADDKVDPRRRHGLGQRREGGGGVGEGVWLGIVAHAKRVVKDKGYLLKVRGCDVVWYAVYRDVEAVAVGREPRVGPGDVCSSSEVLHRAVVFF